VPVLPSPNYSRGIQRNDQEYVLRSKHPSLSAACGEKLPQFRERVTSPRYAIATSCTAYDKPERHSDLNNVFCRNNSAAGAERAHDLARSSGTMPRSARFRSAGRMARELPSRLISPVVLGINLGN